VSLCESVISNHGTRSHRRTPQPTRPTIHVALAGLHLSSTPTATPATPGDRRTGTPDPEPTEPAADADALYASTVYGFLHVTINGFR
jgi:hypothetical protein